MTLLLLYLLLALGVSFLCSLLEAALLSLPPSYVGVLAESGTRSGRWLQQMKQDPDRALAAILTLNTIAHTFGAAGVGAEATRLFGHAWVGVISIVVTILILFVSEIIPKTLGAVYAKALAGFTAYAVTSMIYGAYPLVIICEWLSRLVAGNRPVSNVTREEVLSMARMGSAAGVLSPEEAGAVSNMLSLREITVRQVMTPRSVVFALPEQTTVGQVLNEGRPPRFARVPIYRESLDQVTGVVHRYRLFEAHAADKDSATLTELAGPIEAVPESATLAQILPRFIQERQHLFQVVDEYGGTAGLISMEDVLETLLGVEIMDETDTVPDMQALARRLAQRRRNRGLEP